MKIKKIIAVSALVDFTKYKNLKSIPARVDTGARTSSLWASGVRVKNDVVSFKLFGQSSPFYTGKYVHVPLEGIRSVTNSTGLTQDRYMIKLPIRINGRRIMAKFTISDRSTQSYPILIGRNTLRGNFIVDSSDPGEAAIYRDNFEAAEFTEIEGNQA